MILYLPSSLLIDIAEYFTVPEKCKLKVIFKNKIDDTQISEWKSNYITKIKLNINNISNTLDQMNISANYNIDFLHHILYITYSNIFIKHYPYLKLNNSDDKYLETFTKLKNIYNSIDKYPTNINDILQKLNNIIIAFYNNGECITNNKYLALQFNNLVLRINNNHYNSFLTESDNNSDSSSSDECDYYRDSCFNQESDSDLLDHEDSYE
tara:strand:- start:2503 stop:3132 length:630 start_codon:yes stop_codon:yes gene_type:complete